MSLNIVQTAFWMVVLSWLMLLVVCVPAESRQGGLSFDTFNPRRRQEERPKRDPFIDFNPGSFFSNIAKGFGIFGDAMRGRPARPLTNFVPSPSGPPPLPAIKAPPLPSIPSSPPSLSSPVNLPAPPPLPPLPLPPQPPAPIRQESFRPSNTFVSNNVPPPQIQTFSQPSLGPVQNQFGNSAGFTSNFESNFASQPNFGPTTFGSSGIVSSNLGSSNFGSSNLGSSNFGSSNFGSSNFGSSNFGSTNLGSFSSNSPPSTFNSPSSFGSSFSNFGGATVNSISNSLSGSSSFGEIRPGQGQPPPRFPVVPPPPSEPSEPVPLPDPNLVQHLLNQELYYSDTKKLKNLPAKNKGSPDLVRFHD